MTRKPRIVGPPPHPSWDPPRSDRGTPTMRPTTGTPTTVGVHRGGPPKVAGWVYQIHTHDDPNMYVGQSSRAPGRRVDEERRTMPWGPDILPGRDGYTIVRKVLSSGDPTIDAILLDLAEAQEIRRLNPTDNINRPDPAIFVARLAAARAGLPTTDLPGDSWGPHPFAPSAPHGPRPPRRGARRGAARPARRGPAVADRGVDLAVVAKIVGFALLSVLSVIVVWPLAQAWPHPSAPWVAVPIAAVLGPAAIATTIRNAFGSKPKRRTRRRR